MVLSIQSKFLSKLQNSHQALHSFRIVNQISCLFLTEVSTLFPKRNKQVIFCFELVVQKCKLEICFTFFSAFNIHSVSKLILYQLFLKELHGQ